MLKIIKCGIVTSPGDGTLLRRIRKGKTALAPPCPGKALAAGTIPHFSTGNTVCARTKKNPEYFS